MKVMYRVDNSRYMNRYVVLEFHAYKYARYLIYSKIYPHVIGLTSRIPPLTTNPH